MFIFKWYIPFVGLYVVIVVEVLVGYLCSRIIKVFNTCEDVLMESTFLVGKGIASEYGTLEVDYYLLQQPVGRGEESKACIVGLEMFFFRSLKSNYGMGLLSAVTCMDFLEINGFRHESATNRFVGCLIDIFYIVTVCLFHTFELPLRDDFTLGTADIGNSTFEYGSLTTIDVLDALLVGHFPSIVGR